MKITMPTLLLTAASLTMTLNTSAFAQNATVTEAAVVQSGASERIASASSLRMLTQRIPAAACQFAAGIAPEKSLNLLVAASSEFDQIVTALEFGDENLGFGAAETRRKTLEKVHALRDAWVPIKAATDAVIVGDVSDENLDVILLNNLALLETTTVLMTEISGQYVNPVELVQADAFLIEIASRQQMLLQRISKDICMIGTNHGSQAADEELHEMVQMFTSSLDALRLGMPSAGIRKPPTAEIAAGLDSVHTQWSQIVPKMAATMESEGLNDDAQAEQFKMLSEIKAEMDHVVSLYLAATGNQT